jgi:hypothetical protein
MASRNKFQEALNSTGMSPRNYIKAQMRRTLQNRKRAERNEIRRQEHVNYEAVARALLNAEGNNANVNAAEINAFIDPETARIEAEINELRLRVSTLAHANPVNSVELEKASTMLDLVEAQQMLKLVEKTIPEYIERYGGESYIVQDMYNTERETQERIDSAIARLQALEAARGGRRRSTRRRSKKTRRN